MIIDDGEEIKLRHASTNQYVYVSRDIYGIPPDNVVEARSDDENNGRTRFQLQRTPSGNFRFLNTATQMHLFVSGDKLGIPPDNAVEARDDENNKGRTRFLFQPTPSGTYKFFNVKSKKYLFVSGDKSLFGQPDNIVEAHSDENDPRNEFYIEDAVSIHEAIKKKNLKKVKALLSEDSNNLELCDKLFGATPLCWAAHYGRELILRFLLSEGADVSAKTNKSETALHWAVRSDNKAIIWILLQQKRVKINKQNEDGKTPLHCAIEEHKFKAAEMLIVDGKVDITLIDKTNKAIWNLLEEKYLQGKNNQSIAKLCALLMVKKNLDDLPSGFGNDQHFKMEVIRWRDKIRRTNQELQFCEYSIATDLARATCNNNGEVYNHKPLKKIYRKLLGDPNLKPLLEVARLATLGYRNLNNQKLSIQIDDKNKKADTLIMNLENNVAGIYFSDGNIYIGGNQGDKRDFYGVLLHEIAHSVAYEVYLKNDCNPYFQYDEDSQQKFQAICDELEQKKDKLHPILKSVFVYYPESQWHAELIVRIAQLIALKKDNIIKDQCSNLFSYYKDVFLVKCDDKIKQIKKENCVFDFRCTQIMFANAIGSSKKTSSFFPSNIPASASSSYQQRHLNQCPA